MKNKKNNNLFTKFDQTVYFRGDDSSHIQYTSKSYKKIKK